MGNKYIIKNNLQSCEISKPNTTLLVYKIPYDDVVSKSIGFNIQNSFIVYILQGKNKTGEDVLYVGKSKNGLLNRPTAHEDKCDNWRTCYVLTQFKERTFFNDGTIQYIENKISERVNEVNTFINTTKNTNAGTANKDDEEECDDYLDQAYKMLNIIGLDLITNSEDALAEADVEDEATAVENRKKIPNGTYYLSRKIKRLDNIELKGIMEVKDGQFTLKAGSDISPDVVGNEEAITKARNRASIENNKLKEDLLCNSPSLCGEVIIGSACNGWTNWKNSDGQAIDIYRSAIK